MKKKNRNYKFRSPANEVQHEYKRRTCLSCGKMFMSWGIGNRICNPCKSRSRGLWDDYVQEGGYKRGHIRVR